MRGKRMRFRVIDKGPLSERRRQNSHLESARRHRGRRPSCPVYIFRHFPTNLPVPSQVPAGVSAPLSLTTAAPFRNSTSIQEAGFPSVLSTGNIASTLAGEPMRPEGFSVNLTAHLPSRFLSVVLKSIVSGRTTTRHVTLFSSSHIDTSVTTIFPVKPFSLYS